MRIDVRGRNLELTDELREAVATRFARIGRQVAEEAILDVELREERNPAIADSQIAEATVHVKGVTLRAGEASPDMLHSIHLVAEDMRRQVKRYREKRRDRWRARRRKSKLRDRPA